MSEVTLRRAPDFTLPILGGGRFTLSEHRGKIVVVNFWSAECPWSRRADVVLVYRHGTWGQKYVQLVGVASNANEPEEEIRHEVENRHIKYPILLDLDQRVANLYKAETTPQFYILDRQGVLRYTGALDDATAGRRRPKVIYVDRAVASLLQDKTPSPTVTSPYGCAIVRAAPTTGTALQKVDM